MINHHHPDYKRIEELEKENHIYPPGIDPDTGHVFGCKCGYCLWKNETLNGQILPQPET